MWKKFCRCFISIKLKTEDKSQNVTEGGVLLSVSARNKINIQNGNWRSSEDIYFTLLKEAKVVEFYKVNLGVIAFMYNAFSLY